MESLDKLLQEMSRSTDKLRDVHQKQTEIAGKQGDSFLATKEQCIQRIVTGLHKTMGVKRDSRLEEKLWVAFQHMDLMKMINWVKQMEEFNFTHPEWKELIEVITVHETYFYRNPEQLNFIQQEIFQELIERKEREKDHKIKIWSAGCSTGEEPYTLAMLLLLELRRSGHAKEVESGELKPNTGWSFEITGTDISKRVVDKAKEGEYRRVGLGSFRDFPTELERFFRQHYPTNGRDKLPLYRVEEYIRQKVDFRIHNLKLDSPPSDDFDLIVCRNVLIYFTDAVKEAIERKFHSGLKENGYLVLGTTDQLLCPELFQSKWKRDLVAYRKK